LKTTFSPVIAGTMTWGLWGKNYSAKEMSEMMHHCLESGIHTFDHADIYGGYTTEADFGNGFAQSGVSREKIQLISKCGIQKPCDNRPVSIKHYDYSAKHILDSVENSLRNLKTDYLDLLLLHRPSPLMNADEIAETVQKLKSNGKILDFGLSNFTPLQTDLIRQKTEVSYNQIEFSATHLEPMLDGSLDHMQIHNIRPMAWSPLGSVFKDENPQSLRLRDLLVSLVVKYEVSSDLILLAWILKHPSKVLPVCGTANPDRIKELMKATKIELELEDWFSIWSESVGVEVP